MNTLTPGTYRARALSTSFGHTKNGKEELTIKFTVTEGEMTGEEIYGRLYFSEGCIERTKESLGHLGFGGDFLALCADVIPDASAILPGECLLVLADEEYNGKVTTKVKWINSLYGKGGGAMRPAQAPLASQERKDFAARMKASMGTFAASPARPIGAGAGAGARGSSAAHAAAPKLAPRTAPVNEADFMGDPAQDEIPF